MLTDDEKACLEHIKQAAILFAHIVGDDVTRASDLNEVVHHIHILQAYVMAQVCSRTFPTDFRLLGEV